MRALHTWITRSRLARTTGTQVTASPVRRGRAIFPLALALCVVAVVWPSAPASAQLSRVGSSQAVFQPTSGGALRGTDIGYDPINDVYLIVQGNGPVFGMFVSPTGQIVGSAFQIYDGSQGYAQFPKLTYSAEANNGAGGQGGFLVTWSQGNGMPNVIMGRIIAWEAPGKIVTTSLLIGDAVDSGTFWEARPAVAYSLASHRFLVAWATPARSIRGRFVGPDGTTIGTVMSLENTQSSRDPSIAWNSATDEFGLVYTGWGGGVAFATFRRISAVDGTLSARTQFGVSGGTYATSMDVNPATHQYVMGWGLQPGTRIAVFDQTGTMLTATGGTVGTSLMGGDSNMSLAFNSVTGTFLVVGQDQNSPEVGALELTGAAVPTSQGYAIATSAVHNATSPGSYYPNTAARTAAGQWDISYSFDYAKVYNQVIASASVGTPICTLIASASAPSTSAPTVAFFGSSTTIGCKGVIPTYAWSFSDGGSSALQNPVYTFSAPGTYTWALTVTAGGTTTTKIGSIVISAPAAPAFLTQPVSQSVAPTQTTTFTAVLTGTPTPTCQWQVSTTGTVWADVAGATASSYSFTASSTDTGKRYRVICTNSLGSATSNAATLTVAAGPIITTQPANQAVIAPGTASFTATANGVAPVTIQWQLSTDSGTTWSNITGATASSYSFTAATSDHGKQFRARFTDSTGTTTSTAATLSVYAAPTVSPALLRFGATKNGASATTLTTQTPAQTIAVTFSGGTYGWTASSSQTWLQVTNGSGTGSGSFTVAVINTGNVIAGSTTLTGSVVLKVTTTGTTLVTIPVTLTIDQTNGAGSAAPFGAFDAPAQGATGLAGSFAVTGWSLDSVGVDRVEIWRDLVTNEDTSHAYNTDPAHPGYGKVYIANAYFVLGSRPDVEGTYNSYYPQANRAGWGYLLLSWGLEGQGNGSYNLYAFSFNLQGKSTQLGKKTITVDNANATKPFGALDTPTYGGTVSSSFWNFGWALTPKATPSCSVSPSNVWMSIDSGPLVAVTYGAARTDIAASFPGFSNSANPGGSYYIDVSGLSNGTHQIGWLVYDDCNRGDGVGSRFFTVAKASSDTAPTGGDVVARPGAPVARAASSRGSVLAGVPVRVRQWGGEWTDARTDGDGISVVDVPNDGRIEVQLPLRDGGVGAQVINGERRPLPLGSTFDARHGVFYWQPAPGFLGAFDLEFAAGPSSADPVKVRVVVGPAVRASIDAPDWDAAVSQPFWLSGWAVDLASEGGSGIDAVHVWAYPATGADPIFLGMAAVGDRRPDVARLYGAGFERSAFGLSVQQLDAGRYDIVAYPHRAKSNTFEGAQVVRVTVR